MSFFGFESNDLEKDKQRFLHAGQQESEDLAVYTWGEDSYDGLGDSLLEGGDDLNDETFGGSGPVGKDFDFSASVGQAQPATTQKPSASRWDDKSAFSVLPRSHISARPPSNVLQQAKPTHTLHDVEAEMIAAARERALREQALSYQQQEEQEYIRQRAEQDLLEREFLAQRQQEQMQVRRMQQQQLLMQHGNLSSTTPPPRMQQSPRFLEHQRQIILLQQQQEQQQSHRLQELQEQLRLEGIERQLRAQQLSQLNQGPTHLSHERGGYYSDVHPVQQLRRSISPNTNSRNSYAQEPSYLPQTVQMQQRLLAELAEAEFLRDLQGQNSHVEQDALRSEAMRKILETEKMEEKRRRRALKIAHMARYNDLMTQSDKDFITRIQVSQLVTQDPYTEDFYAQVYGSVMRSQQGGQSQERLLKFNSGLGVGLGVPQKGQNRRPNAMQRMEQQVERIVANARRREDEKGLHSVHSLQGALGKTSGRSYKAAPRQLLQVDPSNPSASPTLAHEHPQASPSDGEPEGAAAQAAKLGREALGRDADATNLVTKDPLTPREGLVAVEALYDVVLAIEQHRRSQASLEDEDAALHWQAEYDSLVDQMWTCMRVMQPIATSNPHPFISMLSSSKGKNIVHRSTRHLNSQQMLTLLTLLVACFSQLDVVNQATVLDVAVDSPHRAHIQKQTEIFLNTVVLSVLPTVSRGNLRLVTGLLGLLLDRNEILPVARTQPGIALLTMFINRVGEIKQSGGGLDDDLATVEDAAQWQLMVDHLFDLLSPDFPSLFPSTRMHGLLQVEQDSKAVQVMDQHVWQFLSTLVVVSVAEQHQILVMALREKVLQDVAAVRKRWTLNPSERQQKMADVDFFLHALGLDSTLIDV